MAGRPIRKQMNMAREAARKHARDHPSPTQDPGLTLQQIHDDLRDRYLYARMKVDELNDEDYFITTPFGLQENPWTLLESRQARDLAHICINIERVGLQERMVRIEEGRALLLVRALTEAARQAGIPRDQVRKLGPALRQQLSELSEADDIQRAA